MNLIDHHDASKEVSALAMFTGEIGNAVSIRILKGKQLKEHITKTPAFLVCIDGKALFENEKGEKYELKNGDYVNIEPMVKHWVDAEEDSLFMLFK